MYGNLHLEPLGTVVPSAEQAAQGLSYTAAVFGKVMKNHDTNIFQWGRGADEKGETTRRYLVMPRRIPSRHDKALADVMEVTTGIYYLQRCTSVLRQFAVLVEVRSFAFHGGVIRLRN